MWKSKGKIHSSPGKMYKGRRKKYPKRKRTKGSHSRSRTAKKKLSQKRSKSKDSRNLSSQRSVKVDANNLQNEKYHYLYESDDALMELLPNAKPVIYEYDSFGKSLPAQTGTNHRRKKKKSRKSSSKLSRKSQKLVKDIEIVQHNIDDILQSSNLPSPSSKMTLSIHNQPQRPYQRHLSSKNSYDSIDGSLDTHLKRNKPQNDIKKVSDDIIIVNGQSFLSKKFVDEIQKKQESELKAKHKEELKKVVSSRAVSHSMDDREAESYSDSTPMLDFRQNQIYTIDDATALRELQNFENFRLRSLSQKKKNRTSKANFGKKNKKNIKFIKSEKPKQSSQSSQRTSRRGIEGSRSRSKPKIVATLNRHSKENAMLRDNEVMRDIKSKHRKSLSRKQRRLLNEDFYRKYEILTIYQSLISHLKLPKVHFGFRPKLWPNEKLKFTIEEILTQRASLQKKLYKLRYQKKEKHKFNLECLKSITSFLIDFVTDKFPKSKVTREKFILELLWSVENSKQDNLYIELFSLVLLEELDEKEFLFFLMCREHALGALRKQFPNEKTEFRVQAYYDKKFSQQDCFEIIYNLVLNYEGDEIGDFFLQEFYSLSNIASRPSIKITDFLVYMVEVYKILLDQGMQPSLVKIPKSPKSKRYTVKHYPYGNIYNNHTYKCLKRDKGDNGNVNWFLWSDYSKMDTNPEAKVSQYLKNKSQSRSQLINSATKSKIFRKSSSRGKKKNLPAPDLSRGRFDRGTSHSRSRKEIEELLRQAPKSGLSPNEMDRYFNRNFSPEAEHKRKLNPGREYGSPFSKSPSRKIYPFINHSDFQPQTINYTSQFSSGSLSPGKTFKISKSPSQYRSPDESPSPIQGPRKVQTNVLLDRGHGPTRVSYGIPKKVESESLEFSKNLPGPAHTRSKLLDSTLFKNSTNNQNQPHKSTLKDNLNKIYISGYEPHHTEASKSDNIVPGVASEKGLPNEQSSQITDIWPELRSKPKNTLMKDRIETNRSLDSQLTFSPTKHREGDSTVQYELYQSLENDSVFDKQKQTNGKDAYPMGNSPNYNLGDRKMGDLTETKGGSGDNALFAIFDNMATDNAPVQPANLEPSNFYSKGSHSFEIQPKEITPINEFDKFKKESSIFKVSGGSRNKQGRVNLRSLDGIGNDSDITHRTFSKKDYQNILDKLEPDECSRVKTLEEIDSIMHGSPGQKSPSKVLDFDHPHRRDALPRQANNPFSKKSLNDPNNPSILNNPHLIKNPRFEENSKIMATLKSQKKETESERRFKAATRDNSYKKIYERSKRWSGKNSRKGSRKSSLIILRKDSTKKLLNSSSTSTLPKFDSLNPHESNIHSLNHSPTNKTLLFTTTIEYNAQLGTRISNLMLQDFTRLLSIYLDHKIEKIEDLHQLDPKTLKFELSELILKKVEILMQAIEEGSLLKWLGSLATNKANVAERDHFTKLKKLFERVKFIVGGSEETIIERSDLRKMSQLFLEIDFEMLVLLTVDRTQA